MKKLFLICIGLFLCCAAHTQAFDESMDGLVFTEKQLSEELISGELRDSMRIFNGEALLGDVGQEQYWIVMDAKQVRIIDACDRLAKAWQFCQKHPDRKKEYIIVISQAFRNGVPDSDWRLVTAELLKN